MGRVLAQAAADGSDIEIVAGVDKLADPKDFPFPVFHSLFDCDVEADVVIDFSRPEALQGLLTYGKMHNIGLVLATTGYTDADKGMIHACLLYTSFPAPRAQSASAPQFPAAAG